MGEIPAAHAALKGLRLQPQVLHEIVYKAPAQLALEEKCGVVTLAVVAARYAALVAKVESMGYDISKLVEVPQRAAAGQPAAPGS